MKKIEVWEREYDNPKDKDGTAKPNKLLGEFYISSKEEKKMNDGGYEYEVFVEDEAEEIYILRGYEVSYENGGTRNFVEKASENTLIKRYLLFLKTKEDEK